MRKLITYVVLQLLLAHSLLAYTESHAESLTFSSASDLFNQVMMGRPPGHSNVNYKVGCHIKSRHQKHTGHLGPGAGDRVQRQHISHVHVPLVHNSAVSLSPLSERKHIAAIVINKELIAIGPDDIAAYAGSLDQGPHFRPNIVMAALVLRLRTGFDVPPPCISRPFTPPVTRISAGGGSD